MFDHLQIDDRRERWLVGCADLLLKPAGDIGGWRRAAAPTPPRRVLLFRLERIGDLLMTLDALGAVRRRLPDAEVRLVVGSWNAGLARLIAAVDHVETLDVPWLSRDTAPSTLGEVAARAARWRRRGFDLAINFEPDIRSNLLAAASGAPRRVGYAAKGGGALLTGALPYDPSVHVAANALRLVDGALPPADRRAGAAAGRPAIDAPLPDTAGPRGPATGPRLPAAAGAPATDTQLPDTAGPQGPATGPRLPAVTGAVEPASPAHRPPGAGAPGALRVPGDARARASRLLAAADGRGPLVGLNPGAGRTVKEWPPERFAAAAHRLSRGTRATFVLLGAAAERPQAEAVARALPSGVRFVDLAGKAPLVDLAAILERLALLIVGDTGPAHLAAAVGTPVVAIFGPSDPRRYAPSGAPSAVVRADLWCRPCNRMRRPPARCRGVTPDCLAGVSVDAVVAAARRLLAARDGAGNPR